MRGNVFYGLQLVRIIEGPDKRGLDNRGCTVPTIVQARRQLAIPEVKIYYFLFGFLFRLIPVVEANLHPRRKL